MSQLLCNNTIYIPQGTDITQFVCIAIIKTAGIIWFWYILYCVTYNGWYDTCNVPTNTHLMSLTRYHLYAACHQNALLGHSFSMGVRWAADIATMAMQPWFYTPSPSTLHKILWHTPYRKVLQLCKPSPPPRQVSVMSCHIWKCRDASNVAKLQS